MAGTLREGMLVDERFRLVTRLGAGGVGEVWKASHELIRSDVALKFLRADRVADEGAIARFLREARSVSVLRSAHTCRVFDVGTHAGMPFIVMEYLAGEDLGKLLLDVGTLTIGLAAEIALQACDALAEAHRLGIFHRDVKPENLHIQWANDAPHVRVLDFGLATSALDDPQAQRLTADAAVLGSPLFSSPEQLRSARNAGPASDIWSLGVVLFLATSGTYPFFSEHFPELVVRIATSSAPPLESVLPGVPPSFAALVDRCLCRDPADRFPSVDALGDALREFARLEGRPSAGGGGARARLVSTVDIQDRRQPARAPRLGVAAIAGLVLVVGASAAFWRTRTSGAPASPSPPPPVGVPSASSPVASPGPSSPADEARNTTSAPTVAASPPVPAKRGSARPAAGAPQPVPARPESTPPTPTYPGPPAHGANGAAIVE